MVAVFIHFGFGAAFGGRRGGEEERYVVLLELRSLEYHLDQKMRVRLYLVAKA